MSFDEREEGNSHAAHHKRYETFVLQTGSSLGPGGFSSSGCLANLTMAAYDFKLLVPEAPWRPPPPTLTKFSPGHDARILSGQANTTSYLDVSFEFDTEMDCATMTDAVAQFTFNPAAANPQPHLSATKQPTCELIQPSSTSGLPGTPDSKWRWSGRIDDAADGLYEFVLTNVTTYPAGDSTQVRFGDIVLALPTDITVVYRTVAPASRHEPECHGLPGICRLRIGPNRNRWCSMPIASSRCRRRQIQILL